MASWPTSISILCKWACTLAEPAGYDESMLAYFHAIRNFLANVNYHFQGFPPNRRPCYMNSPLNITSSLFNYFACSKIFKLGISNLKHIFLRMQLFLVATLFSSTFGYLTISILNCVMRFLTFISLNMCR